MIRTNGRHRPIDFRKVEKEAQDLALLLARRDGAGPQEEQIRRRLAQLRHDLARHYVQAEKEHPLRELISQAHFMVGPVRRFRRQQCKLLGELRHMAAAPNPVEQARVDKLLRLLSAIRDLNERRTRLELAALADEPAAGD